MTLGRLYVGNAMTGIPFFNAPWFDETAEFLRKLPGVEEVFNPAEHDRVMGFDRMKCPNGTREEAQSQFSYRDALHDDLHWITHYSNGMIAGPDWAKSPGTISEIALHQALRLPVWEYGIIRFHELHRALDKLADSYWQLAPLTSYFNPIH